MGKHKKKRRKAWNRFADAGRALLVGAATVLPERSDANSTRASAAECLALITLATKALKKMVPECRPNGDNDNSFPSEHAAVCVAAAIIIQREYPGEVGAAAWGLAAAVALARVKSRKHHPRDVIAGALIGWLSGAISRRLRPAVEQRMLATG